MDPQTIQSYDDHAATFAERYASANPMQLHDLLRRWLPAGCRVLEIGSGTGRDAVWLAEDGYSVVATDASANMLAAAKSSLHGGSFVDHTKGTCHYPPYVGLLQATFPLPADAPLLQEKFDAVLALAVVMHLQDQDLFEFAYQVRQLLNPGGTAIISISDGHAVTDDSRDELGRLFRERPPAEIALLFERLGFNLLTREVTDDGLGRVDIRWTTLVLRLASATGIRPVDQIETIINRDRKSATYKLALLRALCEIAQTASLQVRWHPSDMVSVPLGLIAERWLYYYWPLVEAGINQNRGKPEAFRRELHSLLEEFRFLNGLDGFHTAFQNYQLTTIQKKLLDATLRKIANTIVVGPVKFSGGALDQEDAFFSYAAANKSDSLQGLESLGRIHFRADVWREFCLVGHWIGEAIILRWAELAHSISKKELSLILEKLLIRPESQRDVTMMRKLYASLDNLESEWTGRPLRATGTEGTGFAVDHVIPFSLWHNNDLWNLLPADAKVNGQKSDRIVTRDTLRISEERIIHYWQEIRQRETFRFDCEISRTLLGRNTLETQWEKPAFTALIDAAEMVAIQRGIERWPSPPAKTSRKC